MWLLLLSVTAFGVICDTAQIIRTLCFAFWALRPEQSHSGAEWQALLPRSQPRCPDASGPAPRSQPELSDGVLAVPETFLEVWAHICTSISSRSEACTGSP